MSCSGNNNKRCYKKGKGRQKVEMVKIQNESSLHVTFSKRRGGLFKKASELATLCAAETAVVVFSPGNKPHSFGHPDVETVSDRFLGQNVLQPSSDADILLEAHRKANLNQQTLELNHLQHLLEVERKRARELERQRRRWCGPDLNYVELAKLERAIVQFKEQFETRIRNRARLGSLPLSEPVPSPERSCGPSGGPAECDPTMTRDSSILIPYSSSSPSPSPSPFPTLA